MIPHKEVGRMSWIPSDLFSPFIIPKSAYNDSPWIDFTTSTITSGQTFTFGRWKPTLINFICFKIISYCDRHSDWYWLKQLNLLYYKSSNLLSLYASFTNIINCCIMSRFEFNCTLRRSLLPEMISIFLSPASIHFRLFTACLTLISFSNSQYAEQN